MVRHQKAVRIAIWPERVTYRAFPQNAFERPWCVVGVFGGITHVLDPAHADDDSSVVLCEWRTLCIENAQRIFWLEGAEECVEHDELVVLVLDPARVERELGFAGGIVAKF